MTGNQPPPDGQQPMMPYQPGAMPPPGPAYATGPTGPAGPTGRVQPLGGLAKAASVLLGIAAAAALFNAFALFQRAGAADEFLSNRSISELDKADSLVLTSTALLGLLTLATAIVFIIWQHRFASNAVSLSGPHGLAPGWAIGGWFIPFANFVLPQLQLTQSTKASIGKVPAVVTAWWITYVGGSLAIGVASATRPTTADALRNPTTVIQEFAQADRIGASGALIYAVAGVVALLMVRSLSVLQQAAADARTSQQWNAPPPGYGPPQPGYGPPQQPYL